MASFPPFKAHILSRIDDLTEKYDLRSPFLDFGCGSGDVSLHLAKQGWLGVAVDASPEAVFGAERLLSSYPRVSVTSTGTDALDGFFATVFALDVLEHLRDDEAQLLAIARLQRPKDMIVITVPTHPNREWRWDDDYYGHVRRYELGELSDKLRRCGYDVLEVIELTFPLLWGLRRVYTRIKAPPPLEGSSIERSLCSFGAKAWDLGLASTIARMVIPWGSLLGLQDKCRFSPDRGHEALVLAQRRSV